MLGVALDTSFNESDAHPAVLDVRVFAAVADEFSASLPLADINLEAAMQPGKSVVKRFWVTTWNRRFGHEIGGHVFGQPAISRRNGAAPISSVGLVGQTNGDALRSLRAPAQRTFGAGDYNPEIILIAGANLRRAHHGPAAVAQFAIDRAMVIQLAAFDECFQLRGHGRDIQTSHEAQLHQRVRADVAAAARAASALRVHAPGRLLLAAGFEL